MVRAELESLATEVAATKITPEELAGARRSERRFAEISQELRAKEPGEERRSIMGDWVRANHAFHDVIYRVADLPLVEQLAKSARRTFSGPAVWAPGDHSLDGLYPQNAEQHRAIKQALFAGSATGARALAREHVLVVRPARDDPRAGRRPAARLAPAARAAAGHTTWATPTRRGAASSA